MTTQTIEQIEKVDKRRYRLNLWRAIALVLFVGGLLAQSVFPDNNFIIFLYGAGAGLTCVVNGALLGLAGKIRREPQLNEALNNEMYAHWTDKSVRWGYFAMIVVGLVLGGITWFGEAAVSAPVCCLAILFSGTLAAAIALLVYDRQR